MYHLCHHYHKCHIWHISWIHHIFHLWHANVINGINHRNVIKLTHVTNVIGVTDVTYIPSVTILTLILCLSSTMLFSAFVVYFSHFSLYWPPSLNPLCHRSLNPGNCFISPEYSSVFSVELGLLVTYSPCPSHHGSNIHFLWWRTYSLCISVCNLDILCLIKLTHITYVIGHMYVIKVSHVIRVTHVS